MEGEVPAQVAERLDALVADARALPGLGPRRAGAAFWIVFGYNSGPVGPQRWRQLRRVLARLDRNAYGGRGAPGAGLDVLIDAMTGHRLAMPWEPKLPAPATWAYFLPELERLSRKWRRDHDPKRRRNSGEFRAGRSRRYEAQGDERRRGRRRRRQEGS